MKDDYLRVRHARNREGIEAFVVTVFRALFGLSLGFVHGEVGRRSILSCMVASEC